MGLEDYKIKELIAEGEISRVDLAHSQGGSPVILKRTLKSNIEVEWVENEIKAGQVLKHHGLVHLRDHFEDNENNYIVLDYISGKDLLSFLEDRQFQPLSETIARTIFFQLLDAIKFCHSHQIVHKDLKLENIMIDSRLRTYIIDFGLCEFVNQSSMSIRFAGTLEYCPPEVLRKQMHCPYKADIFTLGVVLFTLLKGVLPFDLAQRLKVLSLGMKPAIQWDGIRISPEAQNLLEKMLEADPRFRIDLEGISNHPWMKEKKFSVQPWKFRSGHLHCRKNRTK